MKYLKSKPGSLEASAGQVSGFATEQEYQKMFKKELDKAGKGIGSMSPKEKKDFFNKIDKMYKAKNEITAAQKKLPPALQKAIKDKEQKEELNQDDKSVVKKVKDMLKKASQAHAGQAKELDKAMKTENVNQVQTKSDGKGNFNLIFRGKEIGYYHREGGRYVVYHSKEDGEYSESDEVSTPTQAKKLAYDNMNEADAKGDKINQGRLDMVKKGEKKPVDPEPKIGKSIKEMMKKKKDDVATMADTEKDKEKKATTLVGSKKTPVDTKPEIEYKN